MALKAQMCRRIRPCPSTTADCLHFPGRPTSLLNLKYHLTAKIWAGIPARSMIRGAFRALKAPLLTDVDAVSDKAVQFLLCQVFVWKTPAFAHLEAGRCKCGFAITDDHFLGCTATGSSGVHDRVVDGVCGFIHTFGCTRAVSLIVREPRGADACHVEDAGRGPDIHLEGLRGRTGVQVVDVRG
jgi:hypothetical protein